MPPRSNTALLSTARERSVATAVGETNNNNKPVSKNGVQNATNNTKLAGRRASPLSSSPKQANNKSTSSKKKRVVGGTTGAAPSSATRTLDAWVVRDSPTTVGRRGRSPLRCISPSEGEAVSERFGRLEVDTNKAAGSAMVIELDADVDAGLSPETALGKSSTVPSATKTPIKKETAKKKSARGATTPKGMRTFTRKGVKTPPSTTKSVAKKGASSPPRPAAAAADILPVTTAASADSTSTAMKKASGPRKRQAEAGISPALTACDAGSLSKSGMTSADGNDGTATAAAAAHARHAPRAPLTPKRTAARAARTAVKPTSPSASKSMTAAGALAALEAAAAAEVTKLLSGSAAVSANGGSGDDCGIAFCRQDAGSGVGVTAAGEARAGMMTHEEDTTAIGSTEGKAGTKGRGRSTKDVGSSARKAAAATAATLSATDAAPALEAATSTGKREKGKKKTDSTRKKSSSPASAGGAWSLTEIDDGAREVDVPVAGEDIDVGDGTNDRSNDDGVPTRTDGIKISKKRKQRSATAVESEDMGLSTAACASFLSTPALATATKRAEAASKKRRKSVDDTINATGDVKEFDDAGGSGGSKEDIVAAQAPSGDAPATAPSKRGRKRKAPTEIGEAPKGLKEAERTVGADTLEGNNSKKGNGKKAGQHIASGNDSNSGKKPKKPRKVAVEVTPPSPILVSQKELARMRRIAAAGGHGWQPMPEMRAIVLPEAVVSEKQPAGTAIATAIKADSEDVPPTAPAAEIVVLVSDERMADDIVLSVEKSAGASSDAAANDQELERNSAASTAETEASLTTTAEAMIESEEEKETFPHADAVIEEREPSFSAAATAMNVDCQSSSMNTASEESSSTAGGRGADNGGGATETRLADEEASNASTSTENESQQAATSLSEKSAAGDSVDVATSKEEMSGAAVSSDFAAVNEKIESADCGNDTSVTEEVAAGIVAESYLSGDDSSITTTEDSASDSVSAGMTEVSGDAAVAAERERASAGRATVDAGLVDDAAVAEEKEKRDREGQMEDDEAFEDQYVMVGDVMHTRCRRCRTRFARAGCSSSGCFDCCFKAQKPCDAHAKQLERKRVEDELLAGGPSQSKLHEERRRLAKGVFKEEAIHAIGDTATIWCFMDFLCSKSNQGTFKALDRAQRATAGRKQPRSSRRASRGTPVRQARAEREQKGAVRHHPARAPMARRGQAQPKLNER